MAKKTSNKTREKQIPEHKLKLVAQLADRMNSTKTLLLASTRALPSRHFHQIKKDLRGKADIIVAKKSLVIRAIDASGKDGLKALKDSVGADVALFFSNLDAFELSGLLSDSQSPSKARPGDIAPEDIRVEPGPTELVPGPAISELSGVGLKVSVEGGKLAIKLPHTLVKQGEAVKDNVAAVLAKLNILPMKVGFEPIAAYDSVSDKVYVGIKIDKKVAYEELRSSIGKALGFAVSISYPTKESLTFIFAKASAHEKALQALVDKSQLNTNQQNS